jgi:hypothetical protein
MSRAKQVGEGISDALVHDPATKRRRFLKGAENRFRSFRNYHYARGKFIPFARIVDDCGTWRPSGRPNYDDLKKAVAGGVFERNGRPQVLFLSGGSWQTGSLRFSAADLIKAAGHDQAGNPHFDLMSDYLKHFWIPRKICQQWFKQEGFDFPPWLIDRDESSQSGFIRIPSQCPKPGRSVQAAHKALCIRFPNREIPTNFSMQQLALLIKPILKDTSDLKDAIVSQDTIRRAIGIDNRST